MEEYKSKVYVLPNEHGYITRCEGGYTMSNIKDISLWVSIDEGTGDRYNHCQCMYFEKPIITDGGAYRYKLVDGEAVECTEEEIKAQEEALKPAPLPAGDSVWDELDAAYTAGYQEGYTEGVNTAYDQ